MTLKSNISGEHIIQEVLRLLNLPREKLSAKAISAALNAPAERLADLAERFDNLVARSGLREASDAILDRFIRGMEVYGLEHIPADGPLLIVANHPGMMDGLVITANLPRPDLKIIASAMPIFTELQAMKNHLIYTTRNTFERLAVVREAIQHLRDDGAVLIFPRGIIEPDPAILEGAAESINKWSRSLEIMIRQVPDTQVMVTIVSGVLSSWSLRNPLTRIRKEINERQKIAEIIQGVQHLFLPRTISVKPRLRFSPPMTFAQVTDRLHSLSPMDAIRNRAKQLIADHTK
jgi:1-acyl-sn-glycerol-3-phosphate acyltransferase